VLIGASHSRLFYKGSSPFQTSDNKPHPIHPNQQRQQEAKLFTAVRKDAGIGLLRTADAVDPYIVSGAVIVALSGQDPVTHDFACDTADCKVDIKFPITLPAAATAARRLAAASGAYDLVCLRMASDTVFAAEAADGAFGVTTTPDGAATCSTSRGGTFLIAAYPRNASAPTNTTELQAEEIKYTAPANTKPYGFMFRFVGMDFDAIMADGVKRAEFRADLRERVAQRVGLAVANVQVGELTKGSVVAEVTLHAPSTWTDAQVSAAAQAILTDPKAIFTADFLTKYGISDVTTEVAVGTVLPPAPGAAGLSPGAQAGIAIAVIVAVLGGGAGGFFAWKKRRAAQQGGQQPVFDNLGGAEAGGAGSYVPPPGGARA